ncbi:hypothetical protein Acor_80390 [Acrocarpospora corrugata]|uniref:Uncharacterized protein n=1 Tax=Acrocarpospora corrugata TaxID=35763 RepID=A0A5M3WCH7_9ACTN|nr:hypothetical protein Acor_80390 [Acrocarpospora corrugata]
MHAREGATMVPHATLPHATLPDATIFRVPVVFAAASYATVLRATSATIVVHPHLHTTPTPRHPGTPKQPNRIPPDWAASPCASFRYVLTVHGPDRPENVT